MKINAIITGVTGMVGEGVLHECLLDANVERVLVINRKPCGVSHPKLKEIIHADFFNLTPLESQLGSYNSCFFCMGVSSVGMKEADYTRLTFDLTVNFASLLCKLNPDMTFCYVSGASTDSKESGKSMWATVKGRTENKLLSMPFKAAYMFRPGYMHPTPGLKNTLKPYKYISWLYPSIKALFPNSATTLAELGIAMINVVTKGYEKKVLEVKDILIVSKKQNP
ncbi:epimerase [soil metagenome]